MEKDRADNSSKESGIALVTALIITVVVMLLIGSLTYLFLKGFQTNILNRKFSNVYEAANGGVEYVTGIVNNYLDRQTTPSDLVTWGGMGNYTGNFTNVVGCTNLTDTVTINATTADGVYRIRTDLKCLGTKVIPGVGGLLRFPPPPAVAGGGIGAGGAKYFNYYAITVEARETNPDVGTVSNLGYTEAVYRAVHQ